MYDFDHNPPHFHSIYAEYEVLRDIRDLSVLRGEMPANKLKQIIKWAKLNQQFLLEEFEALNPKLRK